MLEMVVVSSWLTAWESVTSVDTVCEMEVERVSWAAAAMVDVVVLAWRDRSACVDRGRGIKNKND